MVQILGWGDQHIRGLIKHKLFKLFVLDRCILDVWVGRGVQGVEAPLLDDALQSYINAWNICLLIAYISTNIFHNVSIDQPNSDFI